MKNLFEIFAAFFSIGALTFGGGYTMLPLLQKKIAVQHGWVTEEDITDCYAVAQCLPGIIAVNTAMQLGYKRKGIAGLIVAALGMVTPSLIVILIIAAFIGRFMEYAWVVHAFNGIRVAVLALIADAVTRMWKSGVKNRTGIIIFAASLLVFALAPLSPVAALSPILPLVAAAVCGIILYERRKKSDV